MERKELDVLKKQYRENEERAQKIFIMIVILGFIMFLIVEVYLLYLFILY